MWSDLVIEYEARRSDYYAAKQQRFFFLDTDMFVKVFTLRFNPLIGGFDDEPVQRFLLVTAK